MERKAKVRFSAARPMRVSAKDFQPRLEVQAPSLDELLVAIRHKGHEALLDGRWTVRVEWLGEKKYYGKPGLVLVSREIGWVKADYDPEIREQHVIAAQLEPFPSLWITEVETEFGLTAELRWED